MKKYITPAIYEMVIKGQLLNSASVEGFEKEVDDSTPVDPTNMLSRRRSVWEDEEEEEEEMY